jgi:type IV pilus assembly protein PilW
MKNPKHAQRQHGVTLIELMVTLAITLFLVTAAAYVYLNTRETQRAIDRMGSNAEIGAFALQLLGQEIRKAGYYPANIDMVTAAEPMPKLTFYTPTDWVLPAPAYAAGLFGCDSAKFQPTTGTCGPSTDGAPDSIVINYFTNDSPAMQSSSNIGDRRDCTGSDIANDGSNQSRVGTNLLTQPLQPLFVSNRYGINTTQVEVDKQTISTGSLACSGSGASSSVVGGTSTSNTYQPMLDGIEDLQITYGIFAETAATATTNMRAVDRFLTASQISALGSVELSTGISSPVAIPPWARVIAVRVCVMTKSMGASPKIADKTGAERTYLDCNDTTQTQGASDNSLRKRFVQVFSVNNRLNKVY